MEDICCDMTAREGDGNDNKKARCKVSFEVTITPPRLVKAFHAKPDPQSFLVLSSVAATPTPPQLGDD